MKNYKYITAGMLLLIFAFAFSQTKAQETMSSMQHSSDHMATHNMLVVGEKTIYLSHLPMFQEKNQPIMPHRYQAILEVSFEKQGSNPDSNYMKDRQSHSKIKIYTINPEPFVLPSLVSSDTQIKSLNKFNATIFRGHLEKGGTSILSNIVTNVKRVVYFQEFDPKAKRPAQLEYLLFGKGQELFLAHLITGPPDFDQVLSVTIIGHSFSDEELAKGIKVIIPLSKNGPATRLKETQQVAGTFKVNDGSPSQKIQVKVNREFYFEEGELLIPPKFDTTPEEKKTGFL